MLRTDTRIDAVARALQSAATKPVVRCKRDAAANACACSARKRPASFGKIPAVADVCSDVRIAPAAWLSRATATATPGMAANILQKAKPAAATQMWSRPRAHQTRPRMSLQPWLEIWIGRCALRPDRDCSSGANVALLKRLGHCRARAHPDGSQ